MSNEFFVANRSNCHSNLIHLMYVTIVITQPGISCRVCPQQDGCSSFGDTLSHYVHLVAVSELVV